MALLKVMLDDFAALLALLVIVFHATDELVRGSPPVGQDGLVLGAVTTNTESKAVTAWDFTGAFRVDGDIFVGMHGMVTVSFLFYVTILWY
jgi:hypothetical protein